MKSGGRRLTTDAEFSADAVHAASARAEVTVTIAVKVH
jgi:hypothetical protein